MCSAPNTTLAVGSGLTARVRFNSEHDFFKILLCDASNCSALWVMGTNPQGAVHHWAATPCNLEGQTCGKTHDKAVEPSGRAPFPTGELVLEVEHRASELAAWLRPHSEHVMTVPAGAQQALLRITPMAWRSAMPVEFSGVRGLSTTQK